MRYREPFTLYLRKLPSGKKIWYYQTYDKNNKRTSAFSTGKKSKTAAKAYCFDMLKKDLLIPERLSKITFGKYSENWWLWDECEYLNYLKKRKTISKSYANTARVMLGKHILPYFEKKKLIDITTYDIEKWLDTFSEKGLSNATANLGLAFIKIMFKEAVRREIIIDDPSTSILPLKTESVERGVLTQAEVSKLFKPANKKKYGPTMSFITLIFYLHVPECDLVRFSQFAVSHLRKITFLLIDNTQRTSDSLIRNLTMRER